MKRVLVLFITTIVFSVCTLVSAGPPTADTWWEVMDRYTGRWVTYTKGYREPTLQFQNAWAEPRKLQRYSSQSIGNVPQRTMVGFVQWNEENERIEWNEVSVGEDTGRVMATGFCINATEHTVTWVVTGYNEEGFLRQFTMVDTFEDSGLKRDTVLLRGKPIEQVTISWSKAPLSE